MSSIEVSAGVLSAMSRTLLAARDDVADTSSSAPAPVDAGEMSGLVNAVLSKLSLAAAGLSEGLHAAGTQLVASDSAYTAVDEHTHEVFGPERVR